MSSVKQAELIEFYRELAFLVEAQLPLPESVGGLAKKCGNRAFRKVLTEVAERLEAGEPLSRALRGCDNCFPALHVQLIESAESSGALLQVLREIAHLAHWEDRMTGKFREIALQPVFTVLMALALLLALMRYYINDFSISITDILEAPPPFFSSVIFSFSGLITTLWIPVVAGFVCLVAATVWLFTDRRTPRQVVRAFLRKFPGSRKAVEYLDTARISGVWSQLQEHQTPLPDILATCSAMTENTELKNTLDSMRDRCISGEPLGRMPELSRLPENLSLALRYSASEELAAELAALRNHSLELADDAAKRAALKWQMLTFTAMGIVSALAVLSMFMPVVQLYESVGVN